MQGYFKKAIVLLACVLLLTGCAVKGKNPYFHATVLEAHDNYIIVEPVEGSEERKSADQIQVSLDVISNHKVPDMEEGDMVRIVYNGEIAESYPAQIHHVFAIYPVDEEGELMG